MEGWAGTPPVPVVVLTPQPADFGNDLFELVMNLHRDVADLSASASSTG